MRVAETSSIVFKDELRPEYKQILVEKNIEYYKRYITDAIEQSKKLSGYERNSYLIKTLGYISVHRDFKDRLRYRQGFPEKTYRDVSAFMNSKIAEIESEVWVSDDNNKRYFFNIETDGTYNLKFANEETQPDLIILDGAVINIKQGIRLNAGVHKLQLKYSKGDDAIVEEGFEFSLRNNEKKEFPVKNMSPAGRYVLSFEYKLIQGGNSVQEFYLGDSKKTRFDFSRHTDWKTISQEFTPNSSVSKNNKAYLVNVSREAAEVQFRNLAITKLTIPAVFITWGESNNYVSPEISSRKINPTEHIVNVKGARTPYVLVFNQGFDKGWKVYQRRSVGRNAVISTLFAEPVEEIKHFRTNGYGNGWYMDETGEYELIVLFEPQRLFYIGLILSATTLLFFALLYVIKVK